MAESLAHSNLACAGDDDSIIDDFNLHHGLLNGSLPTSSCRCSCAIGADNYPIFAVDAYERSHTSSPENAIGFHLWIVFVN